VTQINAVIKERVDNYMNSRETIALVKEWS